MRNKLYYENQINKLQGRSIVSNAKIIAKLKRRQRALEKK